VYKFTKLAVHLLSLVSQVNKEVLTKTKIIRRHYPEYIPWYRATSGGGAITLGNRRWSRIYYTENWFSDDHSIYSNAAYGSNLWVWLRMTSHEVIHLTHALRFRFFILYLTVFAYQYIRYGHDKAPLELEANAGTYRLYRFNNYMVSTHNLSIDKMLMGSMSEEDKISMLSNYWAQYNDRV